MPLIVFHTRRVRDALKQPESWGSDLFFLVLVAALLGGLITMGQQVAAPARHKVDINLSLLALPKYTLLSLGRGFAAYALSLVFTLVYGNIAAHNRRAERVMLPALDVLQSIPVLSFLPAVVLAMIALFPTREIGLELACVVTIFTAQAWNMTFSFYGSVRNIPQALHEVATVNTLSRWRVFRLLELPSSMIGLVWNSMMSMAGGWFVLNISESFKLGDNDYRLPGIGSYMSEAITQENTRAEIAAVIAMILMIVMVDQLFWRPLVVWSERFKMEETAEADRAQSWVLSILQHSRLWKRVLTVFARKRVPPALEAAPAKPLASDTSVHKPAARTYSTASNGHYLQRIATWVVILAMAAGALWGMWKIVNLLRVVPAKEWATVFLALLASFGRTSAAVILGAAWTLPVGILIGLSPRWSQRLQPIIQVVASFPATMLFPLIAIGLLMLKIPFTIGCVALMLMGTQWYILFNVIAGAMAIPSELKEVSRVYRTGRLQRWLRLYIPGVFPYLVTGMVTAAGGAWNATIVAEYVQGKGTIYTAFGVGSLISEATDGNNYPLLAAATVTLAFTVVLLNRLIWKRLYRVAESRYSLNS
jgi:NitT/TauT family transport system permease protein